MSNGVLIWWMTLCSIACVNIGAWIYTASWLNRRKHKYNPVAYKHRQWLLWLSSVYVFVCAFRSFLPRVDVMRICLVDSWLSSVFLGRTLATIAETCFIVELCLMIYFLGRHLNIRTSIHAATLIITLVVIAEGSSWYAVLTTDNEGHVIENSIWTLISIFTVVILAIMRPRATRKIQAFMAWMIILGIGYMAYMTMVNVPLYVARWQDDMATGKEYLSLGQGLHEILHHWSVTFDWNIWRDDISWQTLYFSTAVWISIALVYVQPFEAIESDSEQ